MTSAAPAIDWNEITEEATDLLCRYIRINTTNPPGGEEAGAIFLRDALARDGIDSTLYDAGDGRTRVAGLAVVEVAVHRKQNFRFYLSKAIDDAVDAEIGRA